MKRQTSAKCILFACPESPRPTVGHESTNLSKKSNGTDVFYDEDIALGQEKNFQKLERSIEGV